MSDRSSTGERRLRRLRLWQQLPLLLGLVVLWMLLWGEITLLSAVTGAIVALVIVRLFYLPPVELSGRVNPFWLVVVILQFLADVVVSSVIVSGQAFSPRRLAPSAIIEVPLRTRSDLVVTMTATVTSLVPGSLVVEIDRERSLLFVHVLAARDEAGVARARRAVLTMERAIVRAIGSREDLRRVREESS